MKVSESLSVRNLKCQELKVSESIFDPILKVSEFSELSEAEGVRISERLKVSETGNV